VVGTDCQAVRQLTPAVARQWFDATQRTVLVEPDQEAAASLKRSANSRWAQAKSLFTDRCLAYYEDRQLLTASQVAEVHAFLRAGDNARFARIPKQIYNPPSDDIIRATLNDWEKLEDRNLFLAIGHELAFGLRKGELEQARWSWHTVRAGYPVLDGRASVKNGSGLIQVRALDPWFTIMQTTAILNHWWGTPGEAEELIIQGNDTYRTDGLFRAVSDFLRTRGWETMKTNHALRAFAGSQIAMKFGIYEAQMWLRHSTVKVTEQHYSHFVNKFKPSDVNTLPARWATVDAKVSSAAADVTLDATCDFRKSHLESATVSADLRPSRPVEADKNQ
jgi:integrase